MKRKIGIIICGLMAQLSFGQYGIRYLENSTSTNVIQDLLLSSAKRTSLHSSGSVIAKYKPSADPILGEPDFVIEKRDINGQTTAGCFSREFYIIDDPTCGTAGAGRVYDCSGVQVIETNPGLNIKYVIAGSFSGGIFLATLDNTGAVLGSTILDVSNGTPVKVTALTQGLAADEYFVCGTYGGSGFALKYKIGAGILWSKIYNMKMTPRALTQSTWVGSHLFIVGMCEPFINSLNQEGMFLDIDQWAGNVNSLKCFSDGGSGDEWFTSIASANNPSCGPGFILGGHCGSSILSNWWYQPWMIYLDFMGNVVWSKLIDPAHAAQVTEISDVVERVNLNTNPYTWEYYGVAEAPTNAGSYHLMVWKLDQNGVDMPNPSEFVYDLGVVTATGHRTFPQLEIDGWGAIGDGLLAWGTKQSSNERVFVRSYFNGVAGPTNSGCQTSSDFATAQGPGLSIILPLGTSNFLPNCHNFSLQYASGFRNELICNWSNGVVGGSNQKMSTVTGIVAQEITEKGFAMYPSPTSSEITLETSVDDAQLITVTLLNSLGQEIAILESQKLEVGSHALKYDLTQLDLNSGVYFVKLKGSNGEKLSKLVYNK